MIGGEHMKTRRLGKTGLMVSEIGFGGEWLERHTETEGIELIRYASEKGINMLDCWMADPKSRNIIGEGIKENRDQWFIQGHIGSTWKDGQYFRTREMKYVRPAFEDLLKRLQTDYIDLGMIHYVDSEEEWEKIQHSDYLDYVMELKEKGVIRHIGMSTHNPAVARLAAESGRIEMILFSINPAFDLLPASEDMNTYFAEEYDLDYYAAFPGCSTQTEPSAATIAFLTDKVRDEHISTVWYIEFSNHLVADSIAEAAGVKTALFHTCHNVSTNELEAGATYVSLMEQNLETLRENL